jgi:hypothetical protein
MEGAMRLPSPTPMSLNARPGLKADRPTRNGRSLMTVKSPFSTKRAPAEASPPGQEAMLAYARGARGSHQGS